MREHADIAIILMDVVMETEHAGLEAVRVIREVLGNRHVRIILRTGQPGSAPEREVITRYDINDYKEKTELTAEKLFTTVYTGLSAYRDLLALESTRQGLEQILDAASQLMQLQPRRHFFQGVLQQLTSLLRMGGSAALVRMLPGDREPTVVAATGWLVGATGRTVSDVLGPGIQERIGRAIDAEASQTGPDHYTGFVATPDGGVCVLYLPLDGPLSSAHRRLADGFCRSLATVMENLEEFGQ
jgi:CheY-like chemotaxis protein